MSLFSAVVAKAETVVTFLFISFEAPGARRLLHRVLWAPCHLQCEMEYVRPEDVCWRQQGAAEAVGGDWGCLEGAKDGGALGVVNLGVNLGAWRVP